MAPGPDAAMTLRRLDTSACHVKDLPGLVKVAGGESPIVDARVDRPPLRAAIADPVDEALRCNPVAAAVVRRAGAAQRPWRCDNDAAAYDVARQLGAHPNNSASRNRSASLRHSSDRPGRIGLTQGKSGTLES